MYAFVQAAHLRNLARVAEKQRLAALRFGDTAVWGHTFTELVDAFTVMVGSANMPRTADWVARARLWHIFFLAVRWFRPLLFRMFRPLSATRCEE